MPEKSPTPVFYGSAKPEKNIPKKEPSHLVQGITEVFDKWLDRMGSKDVEDRFIKAHETVKNTLTDKQQQEVFAKTIPSWKRAGKVAGIAATAIDFSLIGYGISKGINIHKYAENAQFWLYLDAQPSRFELNPIKKIKKHLFDTLYWLIYGEHVGPESFSRDTKASQRILLGDKIYTAIPIIGSLAILAGLAPAHEAAKGIAWTAETIGKIQAKSLNAQTKKAK